MSVLADAGFDFVIIDGEHGPFGIETMADLSRAARQAGMTPIVRVPELGYAAVTRPLDAGAQGIMVPRITHPDEVRQVVTLMKYPPMGRRGSVLGRGHTQFRGGSLAETMEDANARSFLVVQVETREALDRVDEIAAVQGVDAVLLGPTDLSVALGIPGKLTDPLLQGAIDRVLRACAAGRAVPAVHVNVLEQGEAWAQRGMRMVSFSSEIALLSAASAASVLALRKSFPPGP
jgi:2-keto-3-deoxy-L-rhamnonate aldolase RhmA